MSPRQRRSGVLTPTPSMTISGTITPPRSHGAVPGCRSTRSGLRPAQLQTLAASTFTFPNRILFGAGARGLLAGELARLGMTRPLVVTDPGLDRRGTDRAGRRPAGKTSGCLQRGPIQPDRGGRPGRSGSLSQRELRWTDRDRRRQPDRCRQGDPAAGHASRPARRLRLDPRRSGEDQTLDAADGRCSHDGRDGQ